MDICSQQWLLTISMLCSRGELGNGQQQERLGATEPSSVTGIVCGKHGINSFGTCFGRRLRKVGARKYVRCQASCLGADEGHQRTAVHAETIISWMLATLLSAGLIRVR